MSGLDDGNPLQGEPEAPSLTSRDLMNALLDRIGNAIRETRTAQAKTSQPYLSGAVAENWLENEIAPILKEYQAKLDAAVGAIHPCPLCDDGEIDLGRATITARPQDAAFRPERLNIDGTPGTTTASAAISRSPRVFEYSCGHRVMMYVAADGTARQMLPMSSNALILPGQTARIVARPQRAAFRPDRLIIGGTPDNWIIADIIIGNRSQIAQAGELPGAMFGADVPDNQLDLETAQTAMDIVLDVRLDVRYVGDNPDGEMFIASFIDDP